MRKIKTLTLLIILCLLLTGCPDKRQLENLGIINARGIDIEDQNEIKTNFVIFQFEEQSQDITKVVSGTGGTPTGAVNNANYESNFLLELGKIQLDLYGLEAAKKGIAPYLDMLNRNPNTPDTMYLALSKTTAEDILKMNEQDISMNIGQYLHDVIEESSTSKKHFPKMTLQKFMRFYGDVGRDPILPIFEVLDGKPKITSIGVFQDDKYVGDLPIHDRELFNLNFGRVKEEWMEFSIPSKPFQNGLSKLNDDDIHLTIDIIRNKSDIKLVNKEALEFDHSFKLEVRLIDISEHENLNIEDTKIQKKIEKEVGKKLRSRYEKLLNELQDFDSDVLGYGEIYRQKKRDQKLTNQEWRKLYPDIDVTYTVDIKFIGHGEIF